MNKNIFFELVNMFSRIVTLILTFSGIFIAIFWGAQTKIELSYFFAILGLALFFTLLFIPLLLSENWNISKFLSIAMNVIYFVIVNASVLATGFFLEWFAADNFKMIIGFEATIVAVYLVITILRWLSACNTANKMNDRLRMIKQN